jgi:hypothetical protein
MKFRSAQAAEMIGVAAVRVSEEKVPFWECAGTGGPLLSAPS